MNTGLPIAADCTHLRRSRVYPRGYGCALTRKECEQIHVNPDLSKCPTFESRSVQTTLPEADCIYCGDPIRDADGMRVLAECPTCPSQLDRPNKQPLHLCSHPANEQQRCTRQGKSDYWSCAGCAHKKTKNAFQVKSISAGIGDNLMAACIAEGLRRQWAPNAEVFTLVSDWARQWLDLFEGGVLTKPMNALTVFCEHDAKTESFKAFTGQGLARWEYWAREFGTTAALPALKPLPPQAVARAVPLASRIVLLPFAKYDERTWPLNRWLDVERQLIGQGFRCLVMSHKTDKLDQFQSQKIVGEPAANVAALIKTALCVVSNDSGIAHLAGMLRAPTVGICSLASDVNILGLYPTVEQLGGRRKGGMEPVTPADVVAAVLAKIRAGLGDFPADDFASIILDRDRWRIPCWQTVYAALWRTVKDLAPRRIVEIGTRAGYSAWTMLNACPDASAIGIDADFDGDIAVTHGGFKGACEYARRILPADRFELLIADSQKLDSIPDCDLAYIDGDHSDVGCLSDLQLAARSAKAMLVDDTQFDGVRLAIEKFTSESGWRHRYIASDTGLALIQRTGDE
jgi:Glycosyltransferase family 9 (heptosyltransferase)/Methyltransferase domain